MRVTICWVLLAGLTVSTAIAAETPAPAGAPALGQEQKPLPLVLFVGDSITAGKPSGNDSYKPSEPAPSARFLAGHYGYVEALWEATREKGVPYRFDKFGNGGQAITGWIGVICRQILERRNPDVREPPAFLIIQDFIRVGTVEGKVTTADDIAKAVASIVASAKKSSPEVKIIVSTPVIEPDGTWSGKISPETIKDTGAVFLKAAEEFKLPVVRLDLAWARYLEAFGKRTPRKAWQLTNHGSYHDGVHPGRVGALFQALVFARELGIPAEKFDETNPQLGVEKAQAAEIKAFVYGWTDPTVVAASQSKNTP
jgi:hypothetical protein